MKSTLVALLLVLQGVSELLKLPPVPRPMVLTQQSQRVTKPPAEKSVDELVVAARTIAEEQGYVRNRERFESLIEKDWSQAEPLLRQFLDVPTPRVAAFVRANLYRHEASVHGPQEETYRAELKTIVETKQMPGFARDYAASALFETEWPGRDEWYISLFADGTLRDLLDGSYMRNPLIGPVAQDPERWIPQISRLLSNPNRAVHDMAVACLVSFYRENARRDALQPLIPWLHDPKWSSARDRLRFIQSVAVLDLRESVSGLIAVLDQEDPYERVYAAEALAHFKDSRAVPALRRALQKESRGYHRRLILSGLVASGGVSAAEAADALVAVATEWPRLDELRSLDSIAPALSLGLFLLDGPVPSTDVVARSLSRLRQLERTRPAVARALEGILDQWSDPLIDRDFVDRLRAGKATSTAIARAVLKREKLATAFADDLRDVATRGGFVAGVAAALLSDPGSAVLAGKDGEQQAAFLATSRLARLSLPVEEVAKLFSSTDPRVRDAAERYLETEDSARARQLVLSRHAGEARILGERPLGDPGHRSFKSFDALESTLSSRVRASNGPDEIFALLSAGYWGSAGQIVAEIRGEKAELYVSSEDDRRTTRQLTALELSDLRRFLDENHIEDLGPFDSHVVDGIQFEFVRLTKNGGRRVFMNNPGFYGESAYTKLTELFRKLARRD